MTLARIPGLRALPQLAGSVRPDAIYFDSWGGQFSDNPRAISEEIHRRGLDFEHVWAANDAVAAELPDWVTRVAPGSAAQLAAMARSRYLVANSTMPGYHRKRAGTTFMQTWHGTPLKRIGFDIKDPAAAQKARAALGPNIGNWDMLLSPSTFSTKIFRDAFRYEGPILETGYPRNDVLVGDRGDGLRERARARLGVRPGQRVVLYAPTFRDNAAFGREDDVEALARELGEGYRVLVRTHKSDAAGFSARAGSAYTDVSSYADNRELYLAADALVTDYSSLMFDFAVTRKPMLFYTPDLKQYRDELRGFYFDFEAEAPGPLLSTVEELTLALEDVTAVAARHQAAYEAFVARYCDLDDGRASERAVDALLAA
jgi:CDP-glycerol glycerophosphotransferase